MNKNLYVGNLSQKVTEDDLRNNFSEAGAVASVSIIKDKFSGVSRGFGFVEMETEEGAQEAIKKFNGGDLDGKTITVNEARPKTESSGPRRDGGGRGPGGGGYRGGGGGGAQVLTDVAHRSRIAIPAAYAGCKPGLKGMFLP